MRRLLNVRFFLETVNTAVNSTNATHQLVTTSEAAMGLASNVQAAPPLLEPPPPRIAVPPNHSAVASGFAHRPLLACSCLNSITTDSRYRCCWHVRDIRITIYIYDQ